MSAASSAGQAGTPRRMSIVPLWPCGRVCSKSCTLLRRIDDDRLEAARTEEAPMPEYMLLLYASEPEEQENR